MTGAPTPEPRRAAADDAGRRDASADPPAATTGSGSTASPRSSPEAARGRRTAGPKARAANAPARKRPSPEGTGKRVAPGKTAGAAAGAGKASAGKPPARKASAGKPPAGKPPARKASAGKAPARKASAGKAPARKASAGKAPARKAAAKRPARQATARKAPARTATGKGEARATPARTGGRSSSAADPRSRSPHGRAQRPSTASPDALVDRLFEPVDTAGPKALLGIGWVLVQGAALWLGGLALGVVFGLVAAVAGLHAARAWRRRGHPVSRAVAGSVPLLAPVAAAVGNGAAGAVVLGGVVASLFLALVARRRRASIIATAGTSLRCWLAPAVAAASVVAVHRVSPEAAFGLLVLGAGYDVGAYVWGAGVRRPLASRMAGVITVLVLTFALAVAHLVLELEPFETSVAVWVFGGLAAACCPLGQLVASAILPAAEAEAPALRRLDSLFVTAPAWALALWSSLG